MIRPNAPWTLRVHAESDRPLIRIAHHSYVHITLEALEQPETPVLKGSAQTITGFVQIRSFLEKRMSRSGL